MPVKENTLFDTETTLDAPGSIIEQIEKRMLEPTTSEVASAISIMQYHIDKEARNRGVETLAPEDLCPTQKRDLVRDIARLFRS